MMMYSGSSEKCWRLSNEMADQTNREYDEYIDELLEQKQLQFILKRGMDILASGLGIILLLIPMGIAALLIKLDSEGPVLFKQTRVGRNGVDFDILKFRTMVPDAEKLGRQITVGEDPRITKVGRVLRKYKLDEFPQLINVFKGDMSLVGPRPEVPKYVALYDGRQKNVLRIRPGITDLASIEYRDESEVLSSHVDPERIYIQEIMPHKLELNLKYLEQLSVLTDIKLILRTFRVILG